MKRLLVIVGVIIFFLLIVVAIVFKAVQPPTETEPQQSVQLPDALTVTTYQSTAGGFVTEFYKWYIEAYQTEGFPYTEAAGAALTEWLSPEFGEHFYAILDVTAVDPILLTERPSEVTGAQVESRVLSETGTTAQVVTTVTTNEITRTFTVSLIRDQGLWSIDDVETVN